MKLQLTILFSLMLLSVEASPPDFNNMTNNARGGRVSSSYDSFGFCFYGPQIDAAIMSYNPGKHIYIASFAHGGAGLEDIATNEIPLQMVPFLGYQTNGFQLFGMVEITDTTSNLVARGLPVIFRFPTNTWNGTAYATTTGSLSNGYVSWESLGIHPDETSDGSPGGVGFANTESTNVAVQFGFPYNDWWNHLIVAVSNDFASGNKYFWSSTAGHPGPEGGVMKAIAYARTRFDTNTFSLSSTWDGLTVVTNHCATGSITKSGNTLTIPVKFDRMTFGWDVPNGTITNDARKFTTINPEYANAFNEITKVPDAPDGIYDVTMDFGTFQTNGAALRAGINWFTIYSGSLWSNKTEVRGCVLDRYGADRVTLAASHAANAQGAHGLNDQINFASQALSHFVGSGQRGDALIAGMATYTTDLDALNDYAYTAAIQHSRTLTISLRSSIVITNLTAGTLTIGP